MFPAQGPFTGLRECLLHQINSLPQLYDVFVKVLSKEALIRHKVTEHYMNCAVFASSVIDSDVAMMDDFDGNCLSAQAGWSFILRSDGNMSN